MLPSTLQLNTSLPDHPTLPGISGNRIMPRAYLRERFAYCWLLSLNVQTTLRRMSLSRRDERVRMPDDHRSLLVVNSRPVTNEELWKRFAFREGWTSRINTTTVSHCSRRGWDCGHIFSIQSSEEDRQDEEIIEMNDCLLRVSVEIFGRVDKNFPRKMGIHCRYWARRLVGRTVTF